MASATQRSRAAASLALGLGVAALLASPARATTVRRVSLSDMTGKAEHVVHARAIANDVTLNESDGYYYTVTTFEVIDKAKGPLRPGELLEIEIIGGHPPGGEWATIVADAPRFAIGEEVVLFATPGREKFHYLAGFFQGAVRLRRDEGGGLVLRSAPPEVLPPGGRLAHRPEDLSTLTVPYARQVVGRDLVPLGPAPQATPETDPGRGRAAGQAGTAPGAQAGTQAGAHAGMSVGSFLERVRSIHAAQAAPREVGR